MLALGQTLGLIYYGPGSTKGKRGVYVTDNDYIFGNRLGAEIINSESWLTIKNAVACEQQETD